jgi:hypothetical protein
MIEKQEIIETLKHCANGDADNQCDGCPGECGFDCKFMMGNKSKFVEIPSVIIDGVIECLDGHCGTDDYQRGAADAWQLARKIVTPKSEGGLSAKDIDNIFGTYAFYEIFDSSYEEARDKINAYDEICVGDEVVFGSDKKGVVTFVSLYGGDNRLVRIIDSKGCNYNVDRRICKKTGRSFEEVNELLKLIGDNDV